MVEPGDSSHLVLEESGCFASCVDTRLEADITSNHLDGNLPVNAHVFGKVDFTHSAFAEKADEAVSTELGPFEEHLAPR